MLPAIDATLEKKYGTLSVPYGDPMDFRDMEKGWRTFGHQPRYMTNYIGLRNRLSILDENYNYADFRTRVAGNYHLLKAILDYCAANAAELQKLVADADARTVQAGLAPAADRHLRPRHRRPAAPRQDLRPRLRDGGPARARARRPRRAGPSPGCGRPTAGKTYVMPYYADFVAEALGPPALRLPHPARRDRGPRQAPPARPRRRAPDRGRDPRGRGLPPQGDQGGRAPLPGPPDQHGQGRVRRREAGIPRRDARRPDGPAPGAPGRLPPRAGERRRPARLEFFRPGHRQPVGPRGPDLSGLQADDPREPGRRRRCD
ncbi:MAG: hypothetical protein MZV64_64180 [Ignavibacteriales bacterium]|nr:hypothetical protein [Ignavibacteriales bacterium]